MPVSELAVIDQWADRVQMSRSHFVRKGARMLIAVLEGHDPVRGDG